MAEAGALYRPPAPVPTTPVRGLIRAILRRERDLLGLIPEMCYRVMSAPLGRSRRGILLVNAPDLVTAILTDLDGIFPKNDLMVGALQGLVGDSMFVSSGETWRRQRRMIDPAFSHMRINRAFDSMAAAVDEYEIILDARAERNETFSLDAAMSELTADVVTRTIFSKKLANQTARDVFTSFGQFERHVANVEIGRLLLGRPWDDIPQPEAAQAAARRIRGHIGEMLDPRLGEGAPQIDDIVGAVIAARDPETGATFSRDELIDQIGVFFLAGHETTASVLTWTFFILARLPGMVARLREEIARVAGDGPIGIEHTKRLVLVRNVFREAMRLYPPITFIPRVAGEATTIGPHKVARGTMIMIAPWTIHRHTQLWANADRFDPDRFSPEREQAVVPGTYIPFGFGPRICVGAAFATIESTLILARLVRDYEFDIIDPDSVRPVARLTTKPAREVLCRVARRKP